MFVTSSFQTQSIPLLHLLVRCDLGIEILFLETGFHFPETIQFRDEVATLLGIQIQTIRNNKAVIQHSVLAESDPCYHHPDHCCYMNKVKPLKEIMDRYDVWVSGVRKSQTRIRQNMSTYQTTPSGVVRFHPILEWSDQEIESYRKRFRLPAHPLDQFGYKSIGCAPCTAPCDAEGARSSRWKGHDKTECGLHTTLLMN